jgi:hypothetical protein
MKNIFISSLLILVSIHSILAQEVDKTVSITVNGSGKTQEEAKHFIDKY